MNDKIIVFFHIYYTHLIDEYLWYINNINEQIITAQPPPPVESPPVESPPS
jgi:lipopolysaccharide biosynthesis protein